jgi:lipoprotein-anchoring transpeptidase ErfK/SrfK
MIMTDIIKNQGAANASAYTSTVSDPAVTATGPHTAAPEQSVPDPFNVSALRLKAPITEEAGTHKVVAHVRVGKPDKQSFFRLNPDPEYRIMMAIIELKGENETYAVTPEVASQLPGEIKQVLMSVGVTTQGVPFLWPIPLPSADGRENPWHRTARMAAEYAEKYWVRMVANQGAGCYDIKIASPGLPEPQWPSENLSQLLRVAFSGGKLIDRIDHPVMNRLLGR